MTDHPTATQHEPAARAAALSELQAAYPDLDISSEFWDAAVPVWVARGRNGHPWLLASDDLARFRRALDQQ